MQDREVITTITTPPLELIPATLDLVQAELRAPEELGWLLTAEVPESWPPELYDKVAAEYTIARLGEGSEQAGWWLHYIVFKSTQSRRRTLIGTCGFKGPPTADGTVEVGYGVLPDFRRQGYATEAAQELIAHAFAHPEVALVIAETLPDLIPSIGVLRKIAFGYVGEGSEAGVVRYELRRADTRFLMRLRDAGQQANGAAPNDPCDHVTAARGSSGVVKPRPPVNRWLRVIRGLNGKVASRML